MGKLDFLRNKIKKNTTKLAEMSNQVANHRNIFTSESDPTPDQGANGDIWFVVEPLNLNYYIEGVEGVVWVAGYTNGNGSQSKETDHLLLTLASNPSDFADRTYITDVPVDVTNVNTVKFEVETLENHANFSIRMGVTASKTSNNDSASFEVVSTRTGTRPKQVYSIDVSTLTGSYYVRVCARNTSATEDRYGKLKVYKVWGES